MKHIDGFLFSSFVEKREMKREGALTKTKRP